MLVDYRLYAASEIDALIAAVESIQDVGRIEVLVTCC